MSNFILAWYTKKFVKMRHKLDLKESGKKNLFEMIVTQSVTILIFNFVDFGIF